MIYLCCDQQRRNAVAEHPTLNGIDYLEVIDSEAPAEDLRQRTLLLYFIKPLETAFTREQLVIEGGDRIRNIEITWVAPALNPPSTVSTAEQDFYAGLPNSDRVLLVRTAQYGDSANYTLRLVRSALDVTPPAGMDPRSCEVVFSFKVACENDFDCAGSRFCPKEQPVEPDINYLAKDYASFRRLILDRLNLLVPGWRERSRADLGVTLAELLAYVGDNLSYHQDAVATEAYLATARRRSSLARHALLVDYHLHNGCNARVWLHVNVSEDIAIEKNSIRFYSRLPALPDRIAPDSDEDIRARAAGPVVFEPMHDAHFIAAHNELPLYTWGDSRCCLPEGTTRATLDGHYPQLRPGDLLLFEEMVGPLTGEPADADPEHRHVVRLTNVRAFAPVAEPEPEEAVPLTDPLVADQQITEIWWGDEDRLPFALCLSSVADKDHDNRLLTGVSLARGNMLLADHGLSLPEGEDLGSVPAARLSYPPDRDADHCQTVQETVVSPRFLPQLAERPLTFGGTVVLTTVVGGMTRKERVAFDRDGSAASAMIWAVDESLPQISLTSAPEASGAAGEPWHPVRDLLYSDAESTGFVVEVEHDGRTSLRFGDGIYGRRPETGLRFTAHYRIGNGRVGNVGAEAVSHVVSADSRIVFVRNPLPACGGAEIEDAATVRRHAPQAFRRQERAVTPADYAEVTERFAGVQRAAATQRWTGSWHTMFVTVDRAGGLPVDAAFEQSIGSHVERFRMAGHDLEFNDPVFVPLELVLLVCVKAEYFRADVKAGLLQVLGSNLLPDGRRGLFHPDNLSFGQTVYLSRIYSAARQVPGVASVNATTFKRQGGDDDASCLDAGFMTMSRLEVPRLENSGNYPERGLLKLNLFGGK